MKKLAIVAVTTMFCAVGAFGVSITVPFFLDNAPADGSYPPSSDSASFIGIRNVSGDDILVALEYFDAQSEQDQTPAENTFVLQQDQGISFRPTARDAGTEGPYAANNVPIMAQGFAGAVTISWDGEPGDIIGRFTQVDTNGNIFAYGMGLGTASVREPDEDEG